jgi:PAS domain S-box-containing protein
MPQRPRSRPCSRLIRENGLLRARLEEAEETLQAIRSGEVDALLISGEQGDQVFTLKSADYAYRLLIEEMNEGALTVTRDGLIMYANRRFAEMLKTPLEQVIGSVIHAWIAPANQPIVQALLRPDATGTHHRVELKLLAGDGSHVPAYLSSNVVHNTATPAHFGLVATDLTEQKRNEALIAAEQVARVVAEEASRLKDEFLATVSHELRTPLTAFLGYAQLLQRRPHDTAYVARMLAKLVQNAKAQAVLIEDLLDVARITNGRLRIEPTRIDLIDVIHAALDTVRPTLEVKQLTLQEELDPAARRVVGDAQRLQQVVWNLLSNAAKFTPPGGQITLRLTRAGSSAELRVCDSGQGISAAFLPYVFERFRQADSSSQRTYGGLGLGLAIVRHLVELHGGTVEAMSAGVGQGATFTVRLPLAGAPDLAAPAPVTSVASLRLEAAPPPLGGLRILVVDDQAAILELIAEILTAEGATVRACTTAPEALALVQAWRPDVLVSDMAMPGQDGYWLIQQVRALAPEVGGALPAVALTAYVRMEDRLQVLAAGFQQYVPKPVEPQELWAVVADLVRPDAPG